MRDANDTAFNYPMNSPLEILPVGTEISQAQRFGPGSYSYFVCTERRERYPRSELLRPSQWEPAR